jgi:hypothetical protein
LFQLETHFLLNHFSFIFQPLIWNTDQVLQSNICPRWWKCGDRSGRSSSVHRGHGSADREIEKSFVYIRMYSLAMAAWERIMAICSRVRGSRCTTHWTHTTATSSSP